MDGHLIHQSTRINTKSYILILVDSIQFNLSISITYLQNNHKLVELIKIDIYIYRLIPR